MKIFGMHFLGGNMKNKKGMTLVEVVLYVAILVMFMTALMSYVFMIMNGRAKSKVQEEVQDNLELVINKLEYELKNASAVSSTSNSLSITSSQLARGNSIYRVEAEAVLFGVGDSGSCSVASPCFLTSNLVQVTNFEVTQTTSTDANSIIHFEITIQYKDNNNEKLRYSETQSGSVYIRTT